MYFYRNFTPITFINLSIIYSILIFGGILNYYNFYSSNNWFHVELHFIHFRFSTWNIRLSTRSFSSTRSPSLSLGGMVTFSKYKKWDFSVVYFITPVPLFIVPLSGTEKSHREFHQNDLLWKYEKLIILRSSYTLIN